MRKEPASLEYSNALGNIFCQRRGKYHVYWLMVNGEPSYMSAECAWFAVANRGMVLEVVEPLMSVVTVGDMLPMGVH